MTIVWSGAALMSELPTLAFTFLRIDIPMSLVVTRYSAHLVDVGNGWLWHWWWLQQWGWIERDDWLIVTMAMMTLVMVTLRVDRKRWKDRSSIAKEVTGGPSCNRGSWWMRWLAIPKPSCILGGDKICLVLWEFWKLWRTCGSAGQVTNTGGMKSWAWVKFCLKTNST